MGRILPVVLCFSICVSGPLLSNKAPQSLVTSYNNHLFVYNSVGSSLDKVQLG